MGTIQIAQMLGVRRGRCAQIVATKGFPDPIQKLGKAHIWLITDVEAWARRQNRELHSIKEES